VEHFSTSEAAKNGALFDQRQQHNSTSTLEHFSTGNLVDFSVGVNTWNLDRFRAET